VLNSYILRLQEVYTPVLSGSIFLPEYVTARQKRVDQWGEKEKKHVEQ